jgi:hypothetical protein
MIFVVHKVSSQSSSIGHIGLNTAVSWCGYTNNLLPFHLEHRGTQSINFLTGGIQRMTINGTASGATQGFVGIGPGFLSPQNLLHVNAVRNSFAQFTNTATGSASGNGLLVGIVDGGPPAAGHAWINQQSNFPIDFFTNGTQRMTVKNSTGYVGVGTNFSAPFSLIHADGFGANTGDLFRTSGDRTLRNQWQLFSGTGVGLPTEKATFFTDPATPTQPGAAFLPPLNDAFNDSYNHLNIQSSLGDIVFWANGSRNPNIASENGEVVERMRISSYYYEEPNTTTPPNPSPYTRVAINSGRSGNNPIASITEPLAMLHIGDKHLPNWGGHRMWMNWGTFISRYDDMMFIGIRQNEDPAFTDVKDKSEAVIVWGDNPNVSSGDQKLDHFRIIFNSAYSGAGAPSGQSNHFNGLEAMRITPLKQAGIVGSNAKTTYIGFGDFSGNNLLYPQGEPARRIEILSDKLIAANDGTPQVRITNHKQDPANITTTGKYAELHDVQTGDLGILALDNTLSATNTVSQIFSQRFVGINTITPGNTLEINSQLTGPAIAHPTITGTTGASGLRFTDLSTVSTPLNINPHPIAAVLTVNSNGDIVLVKDQTGGGGGATASNGCSISGSDVVLGNNVGATIAQLTNDREVPYNGHNVSFTGTGDMGIGILSDNINTLKVGGRTTITSPAYTGGVALFVSNTDPSFLSGNPSGNILTLRNDAMLQTGVIRSTADAANSNWSSITIYNTFRGFSSSTSPNTLFEDASGTQIMTVWNHGRVGIGTGVSSPVATFEVVGTVAQNGGAWTSDSVLKTNINPLSGTWATSKLKQMRPVSYEWVTKEDTMMYGTKFGFTAQQIEPFLPELIKTDSAGIKHLEYNSIFALLVKGFQDQQGKIDSLQDKVGALTTLLNSCCSNNTKAMNPSSQDVELSDKDVIVLNQNVPNPFAEQTTISYNIPENTSFAQLLFYDVNGRQIKTVDIKTKGKGQLNVYANDLTNGVYSYTLIVDGKIIDTKRMLKTQ